MSQLTNRVRLGAALLDVRELDWAKQIDPERLDIRNPAACVLARLWGTHHRGLTTLGLSHWQAIQHGFAARLSVFRGEDVEGEYAALTTLWQGEVRVRTAQTAEVA